MKNVFLILIIVITSFSLGFAYKTILTKTAASPVVEKRVTGIGGVFFKCNEPAKVRDWYKTHLGFETNSYGATFEWRLATDSTKKGYTQWTPFSAKTKYFDPSVKDFMINYTVVDLEKLVTELKKEGVTVVDSIESYDYGKFVHILDLEGNKVELWEPVYTR